MRTQAGVCSSVRALKAALFKNELSRRLQSPMGDGDLKFKRFSWLFVLYCAYAIAQAGLHATLSTSDTVVELQANSSAPAILSLSGHHQSPWHNRAPESLPAFIEYGGRRLPLTWRFVSHSTTVNSK